MTQLYQSEPISQRLLQRLYWFSCNECGREFVEINHPIGVRCANYRCLSFNTTLVQLCGEQENPAYILQVQCQELLEHGVQILQNHVNDIKYYQNLFPKLFGRYLDDTDHAPEGEDAFFQILAAFEIENLDEDDIVDYLEVIERNYVHGMTLERAKELLIEYVKQTQQYK